MFKTPYQEKVIKVNLKLAIQRLKNLEKKKSEMALRSRKEIADYLRDNKIDRAKIRVEHIIREDYYVEALEIIEMNLDLILARIGTLTNDKGKVPPVSIQPAVETVIWSFTKLDNNELPDLRKVMDQFKAKYGKEYINKVINNDQNTNVNAKLKSRLDLVQPKDYIVERYLEMIGDSYKIPYTPNEEVIRRHELEKAQKAESQIGRQNINYNPDPIMPVTPGLGPPGPTVMSDFNFEPTQPLQPAPGPAPQAPYPTNNFQYPTPGQETINPTGGPTLN